MQHFGWIYGYHAELKRKTVSKGYTHCYSIYSTFSKMTKNKDGYQIRGQGLEGMTIKKEYE